MADPEQVTEPATPSAAPTAVTEPAKRKRTYDPRRLIRVYNTDTGIKNPRPVPETWLEQFPNHKEAPSSQKAGK